MEFRIKFPSLTNGLGSARPGNVRFQAITSNTSNRLHTAHHIAPPDPIPNHKPPTQFRLLLNFAANWGQMVLERLNMNPGSNPM